MFCVFSVAKLRNKTQYLRKKLYLQAGLLRLFTFRVLHVFHLHMWCSIWLCSIVEKRNSHVILSVIHLTSHVIRTVHDSFIFAYNIIFIQCDFYKWFIWRRMWLLSMIHLFFTCTVIATPFTYFLTNSGVFLHTW